MTEQIKKEPGLFVAATPIGNLGDMSDRARHILATADLILCEDTRVTAKLLRHFGISTPTRAYHEHNAAQVRPQILERLGAGEMVALVSDAGTPLISDPGYKLVSEARAAGIPVTAAPGPSAVMAALMVAGLPTDRFLFAGFLPPKAGARKKALDDLVAVPATLVFFESGRRIGVCLDAMAASLGPAREAAVCRELTKLHEEVRRAPLGDLAAAYGKSAEGTAEAAETRGEFVIVVAPPARGEKGDGADIDLELGKALEKLSVREAVHAVSYMTGAPRRKVYQRALALSGQGPLDDAAADAAGEAGDP